VYTITPAGRRALRDAKWLLAELAEEVLGLALFHVLDGRIRLALGIAIIPAAISVDLVALVHEAKPQPSPAHDPISVGRSSAVESPETESMRADARCRQLYAGSRTRRNLRCCGSG
jgi:hypothetical protein